MNRSSSIQALRGLAFLLIFTWHIGTSFQGSSGVSVFFVLSGFLLMLRHADEEIPLTGSLRFSWDHIKRHYVLHVIMSLAALPFLIRSIPDEPLRVIKRVAANLLLVHTWIPYLNVRYSLNRVSWFLSAMVFLYAMFPLIRKILKCIKSKWKLILIALVIFAAQFLFALYTHRLHQAKSISNETLKGLTYNAPLFRLGDFTIGCILGRLYSAAPPRGERHILVTDIACLAVFAAACAVREIYFHERYYWWTLTVLPLAGACAVVWVFMRNGSFVIRSISEIKPLIYLGNISAPAFLIHFTLIQYLTEYFPVLTSDFSHRRLLGLITMALTVLLSELWLRCSARIKARRLERASAG